MLHQNASADATLISIIITCFNHARYLPEAIESALAQSYETTEIIVVDDGSTDHTSTVPRAYPSATYIYQENQGLAAARNTGWRACRGDFVVFLDADDRLLPDALSAGLSCLQANPECAFVSGHFRYVKADGSFLREFPPASVDRDHYRAFLRGNYVAMHATVMYRRAVLEWVGGFNTSLDACEDYDLYLRIARQHPICCHATVVAEYRQHNANMSRDAGLMLRTAVEVLRSQQAYVDAEGSLRKAFRVGLRSWILHYGKHLIRQLFVACRHRDLKQALRALAILFHYCPYYFSTSIQRARRKIWRRNSPSPVGKIDFGKLRHKVLLGQNVGYGNAQGAGSYYIEHFLRREAAAAKGRILKIGNDHHAEFLRGRHIQSVTSLPLTDDGRLLSEMAALRDNSYDTLFLTHVLQFIYDLDAAIRHAHRILSPGGVLLATVPGTCQASRQINESQPYWRFTSVSLRTLIESVFPPQGINIESFGNVFVAIADMHQLAASELSERELKHRDNHYPLVVTLKAEKSTDDVSCDR